MNEIIIDKLIPKVFASEPPEDSEVWLKRVVFGRGETILIEARSGAGKTSLASFLMGLRTDFDGSILYDGRDSRTYSRNEFADLRRSNIAYLPQDLNLFPDLTARDNILVKQELTASDLSSFPSYSSPDIEEWARRLGIYNRLDYKAGKLSVGQMQRVAILRALSQPFDFIILDEPVSHLDDENNRAASELVLERASAQSATIIVLSVGNRLNLPYSRTLLL